MSDTSSTTPTSFSDLITLINAGTWSASGSGTTIFYSGYSPEGSNTYDLSLSLGDKYGIAPSNGEWLGNWIIAQEYYLTNENSSYWISTTGVGKYIENISKAGDFTTWAGSQLKSGSSASEIQDQAEILENQAWAAASALYANQVKPDANGNVIAFVYGATAGSAESYYGAIFAQIELPRLLRNSSVLYINGVEKSILLSAYGVTNSNDVSLTMGTNLSGLQKVISILGPASEQYLPGSGGGSTGTDGNTPPTIDGGNPDNIVGSGGNTTINNGGSDIVIEGDNATVTASGNNDSISSYGTNDTVNGSGETIYSFGGNSSSTQKTIAVNGNSSNIITFGYINVGVSGNNNTVTANADGLTAIMQSNASATINGNNVTTWLNSDGANVTTTGSGDTIDEFASSGTATASNTNILMAGGSSSTVQTLDLYGNSNTISTWAYERISIYGSGNTVNSNADGLTAIMQSNASATINGNNVTTWLNSDGANVTTTGSGDTIDEFASSGTATASNTNILMAGGSSSTVQTLDLYGNSNTISTWAYERISIYGSGNTVNSNADGLTVVMQSNASATINGNNVTTWLNSDGANVTTTGSGDTIDEFASSGTATASNTNITMVGGSSSSPQNLTLSGGNNNLTSWNNILLHLSGSGNTITDNGSSGSAYYDASGGNTYNISSGSTNASIQANNSHINLSDNTSALISGNNNTATTSSTTASLYLSANSSVIYNDNIYISDSKYVYYDGTVSNPYISGSYTNGYVNYSGFDSNFFGSLYSEDESYGYSEGTIDETSYFGDDYDPIVINTLGDEINTTSINNSGFGFDYYGSGLINPTGWIDNGESMLVYLDKDNNATLTGDDLVPTFASLEKYDTNQDGKIDNSDPIWKTLGIWTYNDKSQMASSSEVTPLSQTGITSISLTGTGTADTTQYGNIIGDSHTVTLANGAQGVAAEATLKFASSISTQPLDTHIFQTSALWDQTADSSAVQNPYQTIDKTVLAKEFTSPTGSLPGGSNHIFDPYNATAEHAAGSSAFLLKQAIPQGGAVIPWMETHITQPDR